MEKKSFKKGEVIFLEGKLELCMYEILSGKVDIITGYATPAEKCLTTLEEGKIFGELGLMDYLPRSASAVAFTDVEVLEIKDSDMEEYAAKNPENMRKILLNIVTRIRELSNEFELVCEDITEYYKAESAVPKSLLERLKAFIKESDELMSTYGNVMDEFYPHVMRY